MLGSARAAWRGAICASAALLTYIAPWAIAMTWGLDDGNLGSASQELVEAPVRTVTMAMVLPEPPAPPPTEDAPAEVEPATPAPSPAVEEPAKPGPALALPAPSKRATHVAVAATPDMPNRRRIKPRTTTSKQKKKARRGRRCVNHPNVRVGGDGVVEVDKSYVDSVTRSIKAFTSLGFSRPYKEEDVKGWYISGFRCDSAIYNAGFRRRDILLTVNGKRTRTWPGVYFLYRKLKKKTQFEVKLLRSGKPVTLKFRIVPS